MISCCPHRAGLMTKRHNNVGRIVVQAIEANNRKNLIKCTNGQYIHWNQELKLTDDINNPRRDTNLFNRKESKWRPDIWYYSKEKKGGKSELTLNLIEVNIPWNDAVINPEKFARDENEKYPLAPFTSNDEHRTHCWMSDKKRSLSMNRLLKKRKNG
jgi:hypothetical protein